MRNLRLRVEYDGTEFHGFARQQGMRTVQGVLESTLTATLNEPIEVFGASRTDAGVHARGQVVNFLHQPSHSDRTAGDHSEPTPAERPESAGRAGSERTLPRAGEEPHLPLSDLHGATPVRVADTVCVASAALACAAMQAALEQILGEHDFRPFSVKIPTEQNTVRTLYRGQVRPMRDGVQIELEANGFLRGMVRLIVGDLTQVGAGVLPVDALAERLRTRQQATLMAPARAVPDLGTL